MSFLGGIAALGLAGQGYNETDAALQRKKINDMAVEEALRRDKLAKGLRAAMMGIKPVMATPGQDMKATADENDPWDPGFETPVPGTGVSSSGGPDIRGKAKAAEDYLAGQGDLEGAMKYRAALKAMDDEGYKSVVAGVAAGRDPSEIAQEFNKTGAKRIVGATRQGSSYRFRYDDGTESEYQQSQMQDLAGKLGYMKKPEQKIIPQGSILTQDGVPIVTNPRPAPRDPYGPEARAFEQFKAGLKASAAGAKSASDPADIRSLDALVTRYGMDRDKAIGLVFRVKEAGGKTREQRIQAWANVLKGDPGLAMDSKKLISEATKLVDMQDSTGGGAKKAPAAAPASTGKRKPPVVGYELNGFVYKGGDANDPASWVQKGQ